MMRPTDASGSYRATAEDYLEWIVAVLRDVGRSVPRRPLSDGIDLCIRYFKIATLDDVGVQASFLELALDPTIPVDRLLYLYTRLFELGLIDVVNFSTICQHNPVESSEANSVQYTNFLILKAIATYEVDINASGQLCELIIRKKLILPQELQHEFLNLLLKFVHEKTPAPIDNSIDIFGWIETNIFPLKDKDPQLFFNLCSQAVLTDTFLGRLISRKWGQNRDDHPFFTFYLYATMENYLKEHPQFKPNLIPETRRSLTGSIYHGSKWSNFLWKAAEEEREIAKQANEIIIKICQALAQKNYDVQREVDHFIAAITIAPAYKMKFIEEIRQSIIAIKNYRPYFFIIELFKRNLISSGELYRADLSSIPVKALKGFELNSFGLFSVLLNFCQKQYFAAAHGCVEFFEKIKKDEEPHLAMVLASGKLPSRVSWSPISFDRLSAIAAAGTVDDNINIWFQRICKSSYVGALTQYYTKRFGQLRLACTFEQMVAELDKVFSNLSGHLSSETRALLKKDDVLGQVMKLNKYPQLVAFLQAEQIKLLVEECLNNIESVKTRKLQSAVFYIGQLLSESKFKKEDKLKALSDSEDPNVANYLLYYAITAVKNGKMTAEDFIQNVLVQYDDSLVVLQARDEMAQPYYALRLCLLAIGHNLVGNKFAAMEKCFRITSEIKEIPEELAGEVESVMRAMALSKTPPQDKDVSCLKAMLDNFEYAARNHYDLGAFFFENLKIFESETARKDLTFLKVLCASTISKSYVYYFALSLLRSGKITKEQFVKDVFEDFEKNYPILLEDNVKDIDAIYVMCHFYAGNPQTARLGFVRVFENSLKNKLKLSPAVEAQFFHIILTENIPMLGRSAEPKRLLESLVAAEFHDPNIKLNLLLQSANQETFVGHRLHVPDQAGLFGKSHAGLIAKPILTELRRTNCEIERSTFRSILVPNVYESLEAVSGLRRPLEHALTSWAVPDNYADKVLRTMKADKPTEETIKQFLKLTKNNRQLIVNGLQYTVNNNVIAGLNLANALLRDDHICKKDYECILDVLRLNANMHRSDPAAHSKVLCCLALAYKELGKYDEAAAMCASLMRIAHICVVNEEELYGMMLNLKPVAFKDIPGEVVSSNLLKRTFANRHLQLELLVHGLIPGTFLNSVLKPIESDAFRRMYKNAYVMTTAYLNNHWTDFDSELSIETIQLLSKSGLLQDQEFKNYYPKLFAQLSNQVKRRDFIQEDRLDDYGHLDL